MECRRAYDGKPTTRDSFYRATVPLSNRFDAGQDFEQRLNPEDEPPRTRSTSTRDMKVTLGDLKKFGFTEIGCPRCDYIKLNGNSTHCGHSHSKICRDRIKQKLSETEEGRSRLEALDERLRGARPNPEDGSEKMEARAAEELMREGLPEHGQLRGDDDAGARAPPMMDTEDEGSDGENEDGDGEMKSEGEKAEDAAMGLLERDTAIERLLALSAKISEEAVAGRKTRKEAESIKETLEDPTSCGTVISELPADAKVLISNAIMQLS